MVNELLALFLYNFRGRLAILDACKGPDDELLPVR